MKKRIGLIILGACGYMGGGALLGFPFLSHKLKQIGVDANLLYLVDPAKDAGWSNILSWCEKGLECSPGIFRNIKDALHSIRFFRSENTNQFPIIIYDASPAQFHFGNLSEIVSQNNNLFYLGEKPLILDLEQIKDLNNLPEDYSFFCELIETENPVFKEVKRYILNNGLIPKKMSFWRAGDSGIKHAIGAGRKGITGGALIDKSAHDFSISLGILEPDDVIEFSEDQQGSRIIEADIHYFIIAKEYYENNIRAFLDASNHMSEHIELDYHKDRTKLAADGLFSTSIVWKHKRLGEIKAEYLFSWIGFTGYPDESKAHPWENKFIRILGQFGFQQNDWLAIAEDRGPKPYIASPIDSAYKLEDISSAKFKCRIEEVRIGIIECDKTTIVCNFLTKYGQLSRYAFAFDKQSKRTQIYQESQGQDYRHLKDENLASVFYMAALECLNKSGNAKYINRNITLLVHQAMLKAQAHAFDKLRPSIDSSYCFNKVLPIFNARIEIL